jgi:hypothetical protein
VFSAIGIVNISAIFAAVCKNNLGCETVNQNKMFEEKTGVRKSHKTIPPIPFKNHFLESLTNGKSQGGDPCHIYTVTYYEDIENFECRTRQLQVKSSTCQAYFLMILFVFA